MTTSAHRWSVCAVKAVAWRALQRALLYDTTMIVASVAKVDRVVGAPLARVQAFARSRQEMPNRRLLLDR